MYVCVGACMYACPFTCAIHAHRDQRPALAVTPQDHYLVFLNRVSHWSGTADLSKPGVILSLTLAC